MEVLTPEQDKACHALECQKAYVFTQGVKAGLPTDFAREMAETFAIGWQQGYDYAKREGLCQS